MAGKFGNAALQTPQGKTQRIAGYFPHSTLQALV